MSATNTERKSSNSHCLIGRTQNCREKGYLIAKQNDVDLEKKRFFTKWIQNAPLLWRSDHGTSCCKMNKDAHHTQKTTGNGMPPRWRKMCNYARQLHAKDRNPSWHLKKSSANSSWFPSPRGRRIQNERNLHTCCFMYEAYFYVLGIAIEIIASFEKGS